MTFFDELDEQKDMEDRLLRQSKLEEEDSEAENEEVRTERIDKNNNSNNEKKQNNNDNTSITQGARPRRCFEPPLLDAWNVLRRRSRGEQRSLR